MRLENVAMRTGVVEGMLGGLVGQGLKAANVRVGGSGVFDAKTDKAATFG